MIEVLKQALEALESCGEGHITDGGNQWHDAKLVDTAITSIRQAIAELESQEPVAVWELFADGWDSIADPEWMESLPIGTKLYTHQPQRTEPPDWFPAVENILNEYGLQAIDFVADFKAAMKDAEKSQRTWVGLTDEQIWQIATDSTIGGDLHADKFAKAIEAKLKEKNT